jgi:hypothetical protein
LCTTAKLFQRINALKKCSIALKPIQLDFSGHALSLNVIDSVVNIPKMDILAYKRKVVANEHIIF